MLISNITMIKSIWEYTGAEKKSLSEKEVEVHTLSAKSKKQHHGLFVL
jgi:hypothetical protein